ncbi:MAG: hypothetical protein AB7I19_08455 [Planctomycetota bacterium]
MNDLTDFGEVRPREIIFGEDLKPIPAVMARLQTSEEIEAEGLDFVACHRVQRAIQSA